MVKKLCAHPCCNHYREEGSSYCSKHNSKEESVVKSKADYSRFVRSSELYNTGRWRQLRKEILDSHPYCACCGSMATTVDHIIPHRGDEALFFDKDNLQPLCFNCHQMKTRMEMEQRKKEKRHTG